MKKASVKKHLKVGSIIMVEIGYFYKVIELLDRKFKCVLLETSNEIFLQEFYYNIDMIVFNESIRNY